MHYQKTIDSSMDVSVNYFLDFTFKQIITGT